MRKSIVLTILVIPLFFLLTSCNSLQVNSSKKSSFQTGSSQSTPSENKPEYHFALYYVNKSSIASEGADFDLMDIDKVVLEKEPCLTENDIEYYNWNTHQIKLKKPFSIGFSGDYTRFVLVANGKRMYRLYNQSIISSKNPPDRICIDNPTKENIIQLYDNSKNHDGIKLMKDKAIYNALKDANILKE